MKSGTSTLSKFCLPKRCMRRIRLRMAHARSRHFNLAARRVAFPRDEKAPFIHSNMREYLGNMIPPCLLWTPLRSSLLLAGR